MLHITKRALTSLLRRNQSKVIMLHQVTADRHYVIVVFLIRPVTFCLLSYFVKLVSLFWRRKLSTSPAILAPFLTILLSDIFRPYGDVVSARVYRPYSTLPNEITRWCPSVEVQDSFSAVVEYPTARCAKFAVGVLRERVQSNRYRFVKSSDGVALSNTLIKGCPVETGRIWGTPTTKTQHSQLVTNGRDSS